MMLTTTAQIKKYVPSIPASASFPVFKPFTENIENDIILPLLGQTFYDVLIADMADPGAKNEQVIDQALRAIACLAVYDAIPIITGKLSEDGHRETAGNDDSAAARMWVTRDMQASLLKQGNAAIDRMLSIMETYLSDFPTWAESDAFTNSRKFFINRTAEFDIHARIGSSRYTLLQMLPIMDNVELWTIKPAIGADFFDYLKDKIADKDATYSDPEKVALYSIRKVIALQTLADSIPVLNLNMTASGYVVYARNSESDKDAADIARLDMAARNYKIQANRALYELKKYLDDNAGSFPVYKDSDAYVNPEEKEGFFDHNQNYRGIFGI